MKNTVHSDEQTLSSAVQGFLGPDWTQELLEGNSPLPHRMRVKKEGTTKLFDQEWDSVFVNVSKALFVDHKSYISKTFFDEKKHGLLFLSKMVELRENEFRLTHQPKL